MAQEERNRLAEWVLTVRERAPLVRERFGDWLHAVREEPYLLWDTSAVRYATYTVGAVVAALILSTVPGMFVPARPEEAKKTATTADYRVICTRESCGHQFIINRKFGFRKFPMPCAACQKNTGVQARLCTSQTCNRKWVAPVEQNRRWYCPHCGEPFE